MPPPTATAARRTPQATRNALVQVAVLPVSRCVDSPRSCECAPAEHPLRQHRSISHVLARQHRGADPRQETPSRGTSRPDDPRPAQGRPLSRFPARPAGRALCGSRLRRQRRRGPEAQARARPARWRQRDPHATGLEGQEAQPDPTRHRGQHHQPAGQRCRRVRGRGGDRGRPDRGERARRQPAEHRQRHQDRCPAFPRGARGRAGRPGADAGAADRESVGHTFAQTCRGEAQRHPAQAAADGGLARRSDPEADPQASRCPNADAVADRRLRRPDRP